MDGWVTVDLALVLDDVHPRVCSHNRKVQFLYRTDNVHLPCTQSLDLTEDGSTSNNAKSGALVDSAISSGDFKQVLELKKQRQLANNGKYHLLIHHFKPSSTYQFPLLHSKVSRSVPFSTVGSPATMFLSILN